MRAKKGHEYAGHTELKKNKQEKGLQCSGREEQQCRAGKGSDEGPKLIEWGGGRRERERKRLNPATLSAKRNKRADGSFIPTNRRQPQQSIVMAKGTSFQGRKKKKWRSLH